MISIFKGVTFALVRLASLEELAAVSKRRLLDFATLPNLLHTGLWGKVPLAAMS